MKILKTKENATRTPLTVWDNVQSRFEKIVRQKEEANVRARETIERLTKERAALKREHDELAARISGMSADYKKILDETRAEQAAMITEASVTEDDLKAGHVGVREFLDVGKRKGTIEAEARAAAEEKLAKIRETIRALRVELYELVSKIRSVDEKISEARSSFSESFYFSLKGMMKELEAAGVFAGGAETMHFLKQESDNDLAAATKGGLIWHAKSWRVKSVEEAELIALDPCLQTKDFEGFRKIIEEIRRLEYDELTINYVPCDFAGRNAGDFWYFLRPKRS